MTAVNIFTWDGTISSGATALYNPVTNPGAGFPATVASTLVALDPTTWVWKPQEYKPGLDPMVGIPWKTGSMGRGLSMGIEAILATPGKIVLCGLSQGAWIADLIYEELRNPLGALHSRYSDLVANVTFGSPRRPHGHSVSHAIAGAVEPAGHGGINFSTQVSFGTVPGIMELPCDDFVLQFCNHGDAASDSPTDPDLVTVLGILGNYIYQGDMEFGIGMFAQIAVTLATVAPTLLLHLDDAIALAKQWFSMAQDMDHNPHAQYGAPYAYSSMVSPDKTAVQLAVEYLTPIGATYASGPDAAPPAAVGVSWWQTPPD